MKKFIIAIAAGLSLVACTKVIDVNLNSADPQIVIEAELVAGEPNFSVKISKTADYFGTDQPVPVENAAVLLARENDAPVSLNHAGAGIYNLSDLFATENTTYHLTVNVDGKTYEATSFLPKKVDLDSLTYEVAEEPPFGGLPVDSFQVNCFFKDPADAVNYYRLRSTVNSVPRREGDKLLVIDDRLVQGNNINIPIFTDSFEKNDTVQVELVSLDKAGFDYFNTLTLIISSNGGGSAAPANPVSNWSGGALGHFGAVSISRKTVVLQ